MWMQRHGYQMPRALPTRGNPTASRAGVVGFNQGEGMATLIKQIYLSTEDYAQTKGNSPGQSSSQMHAERFA